MIKLIWEKLDSKRKTQFFILVCLMIISSVAEIISIGAIIPFLTVLGSPEKITSNEYYSYFVTFFDINLDVLSLVTIVFITAAIFAGLIRLLLLFLSIKYSYGVGEDFSNQVFKRTLYQDYETHISRNTSEIINAIATKTNIVIGSVLNPLLMLISSLFILIGITFALIYIDYEVTLTLLIIFSISYFLMSYTTKSILKKNSKIISHQSNQMIKVIQEGLGGIRDVLINGHQTFYSESYRAADSKFRNAGAINKFIISSPRFIMETIGMLVISILAYLITKSNDGIMNAVPVLGAMAIGAQKLLPALQQVYSSVTNMKSAKSSFLDVIDLLNQEIKSEENGIKKIEFRKYIEIKNVSFQYPSAKQEILKNLNLEIFKGDKVGIVGSTGSGKTTLLDIIMGLLIPSFGDIFIDGFKLTSNNRVNWQKNLSHVPQEVYLSDVSIAENIALGFKKNEIDLKQIMKVCEAAGVNSFISDLPNSYETLVGEKGVKLSGGQKQRIGIARALYRKSDILLLDEATSALDVRTEKDVMEKIQNLDKNLTIIMIAHRISTLRNCDYILEVNQGKIHKRLYDEIA